MTLLDAGNKSGGASLYPDVVMLADERARMPDLVGAKAANLAQAMARGHQVMDGFVITTAGVRGWLGSGASTPIHTLWRRLSDAGATPLVVRSSSTIEDAQQSSHAGRFTSVLRVQGWSRFVDAVDEVIASADQADLNAPIAVLVQPWLDAAMGGVAFGRDPVTGANEIVVSTVAGGPHTLVSGVEQGETLRMNRRGHVRGVASAAGPKLSRRVRRGLAQLLSSLAREFGGPQDVEWATDRGDNLWLLQTRPITATGSTASGPVLGPGPIAETFPEQLAPLEEDLWLDPLREGLVEALVLSGARSRSHIARSPVLISIGGRPAVDLDLIGVAPGKRRWWRALDPRPGARRVNAAWRVGRLRAALPRLAEDVVHDVDADLLDVSNLADLNDDQLVLVLRNAQPTLRALHGHEILMGMLLPHVSVPSLASAALAAVRKGRAAGWSDGEIIERHPVTLSLVPPRVGAVPELPKLRASSREPEGATSESDRSALLREALRLRIRWVHELTARAAWELAARLNDGGRLHGADCIRHLHLDELEQLVDGGAPPAALRDRLIVETPSLPAAFRLREDGGVVAVGTGAVAVGAGGGRAEGPVYIGEDPPPGSVLVVDNLSPRLASVLPNLRGLIAETGSPLSHVAILARELGIATVVAFPDAMSSFEPGESVVVDGVTGEVTKTDDDEVIDLTEPVQPHAEEVTP